MTYALVRGSGSFGARRRAPGRPQAAATARHKRGRIRAPRGNTAYRIAAAKRGGIKNYFVEMNLDMMKASAPYLRNLEV